MPGLPSASSSKHQNGGHNALYSPAPSAVTSAAQAELNGLPALPQTQSAGPIAAPLDNASPAVAAVTQTAPAAARVHAIRRRSHRFEVGSIGSSERRASSTVPRHATQAASLITTLVPAESAVVAAESAVALADLPAAVITGPQELWLPADHQASAEVRLWRLPRPEPEPFALVAFLAFATIGGYWFARRLRG
jgi:hypothetical protein